MKIGIITITDGQNYGNRLQNYAMQTVLRDMGYDVKTLGRRTSRDFTRGGYLWFVFKQSAKRILGRSDTQFARVRRKKRFDAFNKKYIDFTPVILHDNYAPERLSDEFDCFVCGSDQIWNARFDIVREDIKNYLAFFARDEQRIAYAASFGTDDIAPGFQELYRNEISKFKAIGVRENAGLEIVRTICGREDAKVVLDPTLLLTTEQWRKIEKKPSYLDEGERFIVTYILSEKNQILTDHIENIAEQYNARIINLDIEFMADNFIKDRDFFVTSPDEFVWLMDHAECVVSDSYHATIFAILFNKPFAIYQRKAAEKGNDMKSRTDTLLGIFGLGEVTDNNVDSVRIIANSDKSAIDGILRRERDNSIMFLKRALS